MTPRTEVFKIKQIIKRKADCAGTSKINCNLALVLTTEPQKSLNSLLQWERRGTFPLARGVCGTEGFPVRGRVWGGTHGHGDTHGHRDTHRPEAGSSRADRAPAASTGVPRGAEACVRPSPAQKKATLARVSQS